MFYCGREERSADGLSCNSSWSNPRDGAGTRQNLSTRADSSPDEEQVSMSDRDANCSTLTYGRYEEELARLRHELEQRGGPPQGPHAGPAQPPPPAIGHGPANLFQGIMAGAGGQGGPGLAPPPQEQPGQPAMPGQLQPQGPPGLNQPPGPPHNPFAYPQPQGPGINGESVSRHAVNRTKC